MRIIIKDSNTNLNIRLPSRLILNGIAAKLAHKIINKKIEDKGGNFPVTNSQLKNLIREINKYRRKHRDWILVEVDEPSSGDKVIIKP